MCAGLLHAVTRAFLPALALSALTAREVLPPVPEVPAVPEVPKDLGAALQDAGVFDAVRASLRRLMGALQHAIGCR